MQLETVNNLSLIILANVKYKNYSCAVLFMYALQWKSIIETEVAQYFIFKKLIGTAKSAWVYG